MSVLQEVRKSLEWVNSADLAARIGALQLCPENADRAIRLEALAHVVASLPPGKTGTLSPRGLLNLCSRPPLGRSEISSHEDPCENAFTEAFTFSGGSYVVFPGINTSPTYTLRNLCKAMFLGDRPVNTEVLRRTAHNAILAILVLSDLVARRAGVRRNQPPVQEHNGEVFVPGADRFRQLCHAVTFAKSDLIAALGSVGLSMDSLGPFLTELGTIDLGAYTVEEGPLHRRPLLDCGDSIIVVMPQGLLPALRHQIVLLAVDFGVSPELASMYREAGWNSLCENLRVLGHQPVRVGLPALAADSPFLDGLFHLDSDKALYVSFISDSLEGYSEDKVFGTWSVPQLSTQVSVRTAEVVKHIFGASRSINDILVLKVFQGIGRLGPVDLGGSEPLLDFPAGTPLQGDTAAMLSGMLHRHAIEDLEAQDPDKYDSLTLADSLPTLAVSADDLEIIALTEGNDPLLLWKYVSATGRFHQQSMLIGASPLDEFYLYWKNKHSYYFSDEPAFSGVFVQPGTGASLRWEALQRFDFHGVSSSQENRITEVACLHGDASVPIYVPRNLSARDQVRVLYESPNTLVWVEGPSYKMSAEHSALHRTYAQLADMIAYWLWQTDVILGKEQSPLALFAGRDRIVVRLLCDEPSKWYQLREEETPIRFLTDVASAMLDLILPASIEHWLATPDNQGERRILTTVLAALQNLASPFLPNRLTQPHPGDLVDRVAPLGIKKKLLVLGPGADLTLDDSNTPPYRPVQSADEAVILDEIGTYVQEGLKIPVGPIADDKRTEVLQQVVDYLYSELQRTVGCLKPDGLIETLVSMLESIVQTAAELRLTIPTRLACFGSSKRMLQLLGEQLPEADKASIACRFLIEYVVAKPPNGLRPFSLAEYDRLMALCSEIINWAYVSDLIRYKLADVKLSVLGSGRLGQDRKKLDRAHKSYSAVSTSAEIERSTSHFDRNWGPRVGAPEKDVFIPSLEKVDGACQEEFGNTLTDQIAFLNAVVQVGTKQSSAAKSIAVSTLEAQISALTGWVRDKVRAMIDLFSLTSRADFLCPPAGFRREDVYPWRFNRPLSHMRRPLLVVNANDERRIVWGNRHVWRSSQYLTMIVFTGRLHGQARTKQLQQVLGEISHESGEKFNDEVAALFSECPGLHVIPRLKKVGRVRIGLPERDLGDIDVVVIHPKKHRMLVVECKDYALARNPHEIATEMATMFKGDGKKEAAVTRVSKRALWLGARVPQLLDENKILATQGKWRIEPLLVVSEESLTPHLAKSSVRLVSFRTLPDFIKEWGRG